MNSINTHREKALSAFHNAMQAAETSLRSTKTPTNSMEEAFELIDLAELHVISCEIPKAESEFEKALALFYKNVNEEKESIYIPYIPYILKALSGIYLCQGRKNESEQALNTALIWEEKLKVF